MLVRKKLQSTVAAYDSFRNAEIAERVVAKTEVANGS